MLTAGIKDARRHFTEYLAKVERGEDVIITGRNEKEGR
jgi:prevent-host-death family protein